MKGRFNQLHTFVSMCWSVDSPEHLLAHIIILKNPLHVVHWICRPFVLDFHYTWAHFHMCFVYTYMFFWMCERVYVAVNAEGRWTHFYIWSECMQVNICLGNVKKKSILFTLMTTSLSRHIHYIHRTNISNI